MISLAWKSLLLVFACRACGNSHRHSAFRTSTWPTWWVVVVYRGASRGTLTCKATGFSGSRSPWVGG